MGYSFRHEIAFVDYLNRHWINSNSIIFFDISKVVLNKTNIDIITPYISRPTAFYERIVRIT